MPGINETGRSTTADPSHIHDRDDFGRFVLAMLADHRTSGAEEWENGNLERFLDALAAFAEARVWDDMWRENHPDGDQETPTWRLFGELLVAATAYE